ncbi:MAG: LysR family transcriptional regulator [Luteolibacter sp.]
MNEESFQGPDIDLYSLHLLRMVANFRGFTAASKACGLSQSALTRQVQVIEGRLGIKVFDRTTRTVKITEAGAVLLRETEAIPNILTGAMRRIREEYLGAPRKIRLGISRELSLAHIPGIFHPQQKLQPDVKITVSQPENAALLNEVGHSGLDLGILTHPAELPANVAITHRMTDRFIVIAPGTTELPLLDSSPRFRKWASAQNWVLPPPVARSRQIIDAWAQDQGVILQPIMELEDFDLMIQFVAMGMGVAFIPRRSLSSFQRKRQVKIIRLPVTLSRQLIVISPKHSKTPEHVVKFVSGILFS